MKVLSVFGTRPEAIKMCPVVRELERRQGTRSVVCVTGQHREMLGPVLEAFSVEPEYNLNIMRVSQTLSDITISVLKGIQAVLQKEKPDMVLVHGDTTSAFAASLACFYMKFPVGHVEAGLRTHDLSQPFPEEFNRQAIDVVSDYYFAPTECSRRNLLQEGKAESRIYVTGNTVIDALGTTVKESYENEHLKWAEGSKLILLTAHRRENLGEPMRHIFRAVRRLVAENREVKLIYPVHLNPAVRRIAEEELEGEERIRRIEPLEVMDFHNFISRSYLILTDSGGIQEEAPALGKPVLVLRETTERPEGVEAGTLKLVGTDEDKIFREANELLNIEAAYEKMSRAVNPYGDGLASKRIVDILEKAVIR